MKKLIYKVIALVETIIFLLFPFGVYAVNDNSADFEDASTQWLSAADSVSLSPTGSLTVEAWIKPESVTGSHIILSRWADAGNDKSFMFRFDTTTIYLSIRNAANGEETGSVAHTISAGTWKHVAASFNAATTIYTFYVNGTSIGTFDGTFTDIKDVATNIEMGRYVNGGYYDGLMDEVRVWGDVRTDAEILSEYCIETADTGNLAAYWQLDGGAVAGLLDETANNNDLTNNNAVVLTGTDVHAPCAVAAAPTPTAQDIIWFE